MKPFELLFEARSSRAADPLPRALARTYRGPLRIARGALYANFVTSLDGVVAVPGGRESGALVSGHSAADRFVMALLRARADAVLIGAGTMRVDRDHAWTADHVFPAGRRAFAEYRLRLGLAPEPMLFVVTGSGRVDARHPAFRHPSVVFTSSRAAARLRAALPASAHVEPLGRSVDLARALDFVRARAGRTVLCEGGPTLLGELLEAELVDELFLTVSPQLAGRGPGTLSLVEGVELLGRRPRWGALRSVRRHGSHLFTRYRLR